MNEKTKTVLILCLCLGGGAAAGYTIGQTTTGLLIGFILGIGLTGGTHRTAKWSKPQRRVVVTVTLTAMLLVGASFGFLTGDYLSGLGSAIAMSFVVVLKMEKLFDERVGVLFAKAGRDGFVAGNLTLAALLFAAHLIDGDSFLASLEPKMWLIMDAGASWVVFLVSAIYHAFIKGE
jgi:hypothetical protein